MIGCEWEGHYVAECPFRFSGIKGCPSEHLTSKTHLISTRKHLYYKNKSALSSHIHSTTITAVLTTTTTPSLRRIVNVEVFCSLPLRC